MLGALSGIPLQTGASPMRASLLRKSSENILKYGRIMVKLASVLGHQRSKNYSVADAEDNGRNYPDQRALSCHFGGVWLFILPYKVEYKPDYGKEKSQYPPSYAARIGADSPGFKASPAVDADCRIRLNFLSAILAKHFKLLFKNNLKNNAPVKIGSLKNIIKGI